MTHTVLITGASQGLGLCLVEAFLTQGAQIFAGYRGALAGLQPVVEGAGERVVPLRLDVTEPASIAAARDEVARRVGSLDALVNNAAILPAEGRGTLATVDVEVGLRVFDTNALGPLRVVQAFLPLLRAGERKLVLNISSEAGSIGSCWRTDEHLYCMSKAALNAQTALLHNDLGPEGFEILAVHPGWLRTSMGGPDAALDPRESAAALIELVRTPNPARKPFYLDHLGQALEW